MDYPNLGEQLGWRGSNLALEILLPTLYPEVVIGQVHKEVAYLKVVYNNENLETD